MRSLINSLLATTCFIGATAPAMAQVKDDAPLDQAYAAPVGTDRATLSSDAQADTKPATSDKPRNSDGSTADSGDIVVTGSNIRQPNLVSTAPITVVTARDLQLQGAINVQDALNRLPQVQTNNTQFNNNGNGRQRINLRRADFGRTLILADGKRIGVEDGVDTNLIPVPLIERIDILTGGAAAAYGADAIGGVVNFILKKDFSGVKVDANYNFYNHLNTENIGAVAARSAGYGVPSGWSNDGGRAQASIAAGKNFAGGRGNISLFAGYQAIDPVLAGDRSFSVCQLSLAASAPNTPFCTNATTTRPTGYFSALTGPAANGSVFANGAGGGTFIPFANSPNYNLNNTYYFQRGSNRISGAGFARYEISRAAEVYVNALYARDRSSNQTAPSGVFAGQGVTYLLNCNNPLLSASQAQALCGSAAGSATTINADIRYRFSDARQNALENAEYRINGGIRGDFGKSWHYDVSGLYAVTKGKTTLVGTVDPTKVVNALQVVNVNGTPTCRSVVDGSDPTCVPLDLFSSAGPSATARNYVLYTGGVGTFKQDFGLYVFNATLSGDLGDYGIRSPFASQGVGFSAGIEHRYNLRVTKPDQQFIDLQGSGPGNDHTSANDLFAELRLPIVEDKPFFHSLVVGAAVRGSLYPPSKTVQTVYKLDGAWSPIRDIMLRGSYNKTTRAPTIGELSDSITRSFGTFSGGDACAGATPTATLAQCQRTGVTAAQYGTIVQCGDQCTTLSGASGPALPETARTYTYGLVLTPRFLPGFSASIDYFSLSFGRSIAYLYATDYLNQCLTNGDAFSCSAIVRASNGSLGGGVNSTSGYVLQGIRNNTVRSLPTHALDFQAGYTTDVGNGKLSMNYTGSLLLQNGGYTGADNDLQYSNVGIFGPYSGQGLKRYSHTFLTTYSPKLSERSVATIAFNWRYIDKLRYSLTSGQDAVVGPPPFAIPSQFTTIPSRNLFDLTIGINVDKSMSIQLAVNNILDSDPPILPSPPLQSEEQVNAVASQYDPLGRSINLSVSFRY